MRHSFWHLLNNLICYNFLTRRDGTRSWIHICVGNVLISKVFATVMMRLRVGWYIILMMKILMMYPGSNTLQRRCFSNMNPKWNVHTGSICLQDLLPHWCEAFQVCHKVRLLTRDRDFSWKIFLKILTMDCFVEHACIMRKAWRTLIVTERYWQEECWHSSSIGAHSSRQFLNTKSCVNFENDRFTSCWKRSERERINQREDCGVDTWTSEHSTRQQEHSEEELNIHQWHVDKFHHLHLLELMEMILFILMIMVRLNMVT